MPFVAVACLILLFFAALGSSFWWRAQSGWYGNAAYYWGVFLLALYVTWPTIKALKLG